MHNCSVVATEHARVTMTVYPCLIRLTLPWSSVTTPRTMSGRGPKPCMDLDCTHAKEMSGTTRKISHM